MLLPPSFAMAHPAAQKLVTLEMNGSRAGVVGIHAVSKQHIYILRQENQFTLIDD